MLRHLMVSSDHRLSEKDAKTMAAEAILVTLEEEWTQKDPRLATLSERVVIASFASERVPE